MVLKKKLQLNYFHLSKLYWGVNKYKYKKHRYKLLYFSLFMHKKLQYYSFFYNNILYNISNGQLINQKKTKIIKFFKKSKKSFGTSINLLNKKFKRRFRRIFYFYCRNYNYKNYLWIKKFFYLLKPIFMYTVFTRSWSNVYKYRRRIKKKILKNLTKNSTKV
jgi:hypothetical protein